MKQFDISDKNEGQRLDKFLLRILKNTGTAFIYKMLRKKNITLNDKKVDGNVILKTGDIVKLYFSDESYEKLSGDNEGIQGSQSCNIDLEFYIDITPRTSFVSSIIYEDENMILINKPAGILSQKANDKDISLNEYIIFYLNNAGKLSDDDLKQYRPSTVNRLDRNTSGLIIAAKNLRAATVISQGLKDRTINKYYKCIVPGNFDKEGLHTGYLKKDRDNNIVSISKNKTEGDNYIETEYELIGTNGEYSVLSVHLLTGRPHQIRAHLSYLGYPILGDKKYGSTVFTGNRTGQLLHAYKIIFPHYDDEHFKGISGKTFICDIEFGI